MKTLKYQIRCDEIRNREEKVLCIPFKVKENTKR